MYDSSFPFDRFFIYIFGMLCMWAWYWFLVSFVLQSRTILHIFLLWERGRGLWFFLSLFYISALFLIIFLVIYGRGWWSNRRFGFVLFCVLCAHEISVLGFSFLFLFLFFSLQTVLSSIKILFLEAFSDLVFFQVQQDLCTCMHVSYLLSSELQYKS